MRSNGPRDKPVVRATRRAPSVSQHTPTAVTSPHNGSGCPTAAFHRGLRETTTQRNLKPRYVGKMAPFSSAPGKWNRAPHLAEDPNIEGHCLGSWSDHHQEYLSWRGLGPVGDEAVHIM